MNDNKLTSESIFEDRKIHFETRGSGKAVVLLHGFLEDLTIWKQLVESLVKEYTVVTIDLPGHGHTDCFSEVHSMEDMAKAVKYVLEQLHIDQAIIAGHSMGGYVALAFSELFPETVSGLALVNSTPLPDSEEKKINRDRAVEAVEHNQSNFVSLAIPQLFADGNQKIYETQIEDLKRRAKLMPAQGITAALKGMKARPARDHLLTNASFPVLIILGKDDTVVNIDALKSFDTFSHIKVVELEGGHMSYIESLNDLSYHFMHFIEKV